MDGVDSFVEPLKKRPFYEERMSNKLCNFHINDNGGNKNVSPVSTDSSIDEITDWYIHF